MAPKTVEHNAQIISISQLFSPAILLSIYLLILDCPQILFSIKKQKFHVQNKKTSYLPRDLGTHHLPPFQGHAKHRLLDSTDVFAISNRAPLFDNKPIKTLYNAMTILGSMSNKLTDFGVDIEQIVRFISISNLFNIRY